MGNGEPPAFTFQAYPGGTGSLLEKMWREHGGSPFERTPFEIESYSEIKFQETETSGFLSSAITYSMYNDGNIGAPGTVHIPTGWFSGIFTRLDKDLPEIIKGDKTFCGGNSGANIVIPMTMVSIAIARINAAHV